MHRQTPAVGKYSMKLTEKCSYISIYIRKSQIKKKQYNYSSLFLGFGNSRWTLSGLSIKPDLIRRCHRPRPLFIYVFIYLCVCVLIQLCKVPCLLKHAMHTRRRFMSSRRHENRRCLNVKYRRSVRHRLYWNKIFIQLNIPGV